MEGAETSVEKRLRERVSAERSRRNWSQAELSKRLRAKGLRHIIPSTVAKIETGARAVRAVEVNALADLFGVTVDNLLGRSPAGGDLVWTASQLTGLARDSVTHMDDLARTVDSHLGEIRYYAALDPPSGITEALIASTEAVLTALEDTKHALGALGDADVPGVSITEEVSR
jgi:transcriptional regulator with XRE-family HTH domain